MRKHGTLLALLSALGLAASFASAQEERPYTEGPVVNVAYIRTEPGMFDEYMRYLATTYKQFMDEQKKAGIISDYAVYASQPRTEHEPDLILTVTYKNFGALDGLTERSDPISRKIWGSLSKADQASAERGKLRRQLGSETIQQLLLK